MIDKILCAGADWLETSRMPPVVGALAIMAFALCQIRRDWNR
jgi:hypothetical protein